jgi:hypothetical protein
MKSRQSQHRIHTTYFASNILLSSFVFKQLNSFSMKKIIFFAAIALFAIGCTKPDDNRDTGPKLIFKFKFDSTQTRLDGFGNSSTMPAGHWGLSPVFHTMSAHYIELAPDSLTALGLGDVLYKASQVGSGSDLAIDFSKARFAGNNEEFYSVPLKNVTPGSYKWLRVSLAYQNYDIKFLYKNDTLPAPYNSGMYDARVASFVGFNTYLTSYKVKDQTVIVNGNRKQGYGAMELFNLPAWFPPQQPTQWQAPAGATTVPNPIALTSPIPPGSCVVTGRFATTGLTVTGTETSDVIVTVSLSTNKSFEWKDKNGDHLYQPLNSANNVLVEDSVVDMGIRGLIPIITR